MRKGLSLSEAGRLGAIESAKTAVIQKQNRIDTWNRNPKLCKFCAVPIVYSKRRNDFCDHSCAASFSNEGVRRHGDGAKICVNCGKDTYNQRFCSQDCMSEFRWLDTKKRIISGEIVSNILSKKYLIELHKGKCQVCQLSEWCGQKMPLVLDHINGNAYDDRLNNLRVICNNCDALSPTFKGRNNGKGRFKRAERYKYEKEIVGNIEGFKWKQ